MLLANIGDPGRISLGRFTGTDDTLRLMKSYAMGPEGERNFRVRQWTENLVREVSPKDYLSEILALRAWATGPQVRYTNDAAHVELVKSPYRILLEIEQKGSALVDCDDIATLLASMGMQLGREAQFVVVGFGPAGHYSHVFARIREPRSGDWIVCDPVAGTRELEMLRRVTTYKTVELE